MCTVSTAIKFQNIQDKESLTKENIPKNQDQSILPCKFKLFRRHIIFCNKKEHRSTDYIKASYVQVSCIKRKECFLTSIIPDFR
jgi:hypothetical protein